MSESPNIREMITKQLDDGSVWARIHHLDVTLDKTWFSGEEEVKECLDKRNRYSRMGIIDNFRSNVISLTNMAAEINGNTNFSAGTSNSTYKRYGKNSLQIDSTADLNEKTARSTVSAHLIPNHKYYVRIEIMQTEVAGGVGFYWPIAEPSFFGSQPVSAANTWTTVSVIKDRSASDSDFATEKNARYRIDYDNGKKAGTLYCAGLMLIDLTASFGAGYEPTDKQWLDKNIPYFVGTKEFDFTTSGAQGKFEFMLTYPKLSETLYNRWTQSSSPNESAVVNFTPITTAWSAHNAGIRKKGGSSIYNCDSGTTWYAPIGQTETWTSTQYIPAADGTSQTETELWVRIDKLSSQQNISLY